MRLEIIVGTFALCWVLLRSSKGTPMEKRSSRLDPPMRSSGDSYTAEEEKLIIAELEKQVALGRKYSILPTWGTVAEAHKNQRSSNSVGFNQDRTMSSIKSHFFNCMMKEHRPSGAVSVPDSVKKFVENRVHRRRYTQEERNFIFDKMSYYKGLSLNDIGIWEKIAEEHALKRRSGVPGFTSERNARSLQVFFCQGMKSRDLASGVTQKFPLASKSSETSKNVYIEQLRSSGEMYTPEEEIFIVKELENHAALGREYGRATWVKLAQEHQKKRKSNSVGFYQERTAEGIQNYAYRARIANSRVSGGSRNVPSNAKNQSGASTSLRLHDNYDHTQLQEDMDTDEEVDEAYINEENEVWDPICADMMSLQKNTVKSRNCTHTEIWGEETDEFGVDHTMFLDSFGSKDSNIFSLDSPYEHRTFQPLPFQGTP